MSYRVNKEEAIRAVTDLLLDRFSYSFEDLYNLGPKKLLDLLYTECNDRGIDLDEFEEEICNLKLYCRNSAKKKEENQENLILKNYKFINSSSDLLNLITKEARKYLAKLISEYLGDCRPKYQKIAGALNYYLNKIDSYRRKYNKYNKYTFTKDPIVTGFVTSSAKKIINIIIKNINIYYSKRKNLESDSERSVTAKFDPQKLVKAEEKEAILKEILEYLGKNIESVTKYINKNYKKESEFRFTENSEFSCKEIKQEIIREIPKFIF